MHQTASHDPSIHLLASRYPLLLQDLSVWLRTRPDSSRVQGRRPNRVYVRQGGHEILFDCTDPYATLDQLDQHSADAPMIHLFPEVSGFLQFMTQPAAQDCIRHQRWLPMLLMPLQEARHTQDWMASAPPGQWPWSLTETSRFGDHPAAEPVLALGRQMVRVIGELTTQLTQALTASYANRPTPAQVLGEGSRPLRVLTLAFYGSSYQQFCARDIAQGLQAGGVDARALISTGGPSRNHELLSGIQEFDPDVLLLNGRCRSDFPGLPKELCVLSWDQDYALVPNPRLAQSLGPRDRLMLMVDDWQTDARDNGLPAKKIAYVNLGTNHRLYHPPAVRGEAEFDVLFVGNIYPFEKYKAMIGFDAHPPVVQSAMLHARERLREWVLKQPQGDAFVLPDMDLFLRESFAERGVSHSGEPRQWRYLVSYFRYRIAHLLVRELYVEGLKEFRLGLFGRGWEEFPSLASFARPEIENGPPLRDAIHRAAINLHLHTWTVHHPRLYDTAAAGGFLLVGRVPETHPLEEVFSIGSELDAFGSISQLKQKVRHYLDHPELRHEMAARAVERVRRDHTMEQRMTQAVQFLAEDVDEHA